MVEAGIYARRRVPPIFRSIRSQGQNVIVEWTGQGILQRSDEPNGPWETISNASSPQTVAMDIPKRFFRVVAP